MVAFTKAFRLSSDDEQAEVIIFHCHDDYCLDISLTCYL